MTSYIKEEAYTRTPYICYNIEALRCRSRESKTYVALSSLGGENNHVEVLTYNAEGNEFEIGYLYDHVFSPVGGVHWMPAEDISFEGNILGTGSDSIRLFKEGKMICDLRLNDKEQNSMRIESVYKPCFTKITSFSFSNHCSRDLISTTIDGRCVLWDLERPDKERELGNVNIFGFRSAKLTQETDLRPENKVIANISSNTSTSEFKIMDSCFGNSRNNILLGMNNGLAVSFDLRSPFKQVNSVLIDCMHGWSHAVSCGTGRGDCFGLSPVKLCNVENTNYFSRAILSIGEVEIFDIRKTCAPLYKLNENIKVKDETAVISSRCGSIVSIESNGSGELTVSHENGKVFRYSAVDGNKNIQVSDLFDGGRRIYGFSSLNLNYNPKCRGFMAISSVCTSGQPGIVVSSYIGVTAESETGARADSE
ncbi:hypothetical protein FG386_001145 [Cryptosporidium ryanae]|uniref:uncharacterized protein n=1 Tax=Cryptosporidium ryanae TaxID=515981 RepID=UPI00351A53D6|nr:hypothetical protein FG386_001145 [Cryptosporidium ryanae]